MARAARRLVVVAGPNGAGKSTIAPALLRDHFGIREFVNADSIAQGLSAFDPDAASIAAGRVMLRRLQELADLGADFAFETTLASRSFAPWIARLKDRGYTFDLVFVWLPSPDVALDRVRKRVAAGGHAVAEDTVRRRFDRGLRNFLELYRPLADHWTLYDNSGHRGPRVIARGCAMDTPEVLDEDCWRKIEARGDTLRERPPAVDLSAAAEAMDRAVARGVREALLRHKLLGQSICEWRDGRVVEVPPDQIMVEDLPDQSLALPKASRPGSTRVAIPPA